MRRIRRHWPSTRLTIRGDGHYGRGNATLSRLVEVAANDVRVCRAEAQEVAVRRYTETCHSAKSRGRERRVAATAEFVTLRMRLLKIAARSTETATRVRVAFAEACPDAALFRGIAVSFQPAGP